MGQFRVLLPNLSYFSFYFSTNIFGTPQNESIILLLFSCITSHNGNRVYVISVLGVVHFIFKAADVYVSRSACRNLDGY